MSQKTSLFAQWFLAVLCGIFLGLAGSTKLSGLFAITSIAVWCGFVLIHSLPTGFRGTGKKTLSIQGLSMATGFVAVPALIYLATYWFTIQDPSPHLLVNYIKDHFNHMMAAHAPKAVLSETGQKFVTWPFSFLDPLILLDKKGPRLGIDSRYNLYGNPIVWVLIVPTMFLVILSSTSMLGLQRVGKAGLYLDLLTTKLDHWLQEWGRDMEAQKLFILIGFLSLYLPWVFIGRRGYCYHFHSSAILGSLALAWLVHHLTHKNEKLKMIFPLAVVIAFGVYLSGLGYYS